VWGDHSVQKKRATAQALVSFDVIVAGASDWVAVIENLQYMCARDVIMEVLRWHSERRLIER